MFIASVKLFAISSHQVLIATILNRIDQTKMAEYLLSEFNGLKGKCVQKEIIEEMDNIDLKNEVEINQNNGEKVCEDDGKW